MSENNTKYAIIITSNKVIFRSAVMKFWGAWAAAVS